jgi:5-methyltetrahydropteroyltriglutamate--homocysteine methyltransferase
MDLTRMTPPFRADHVGSLLRSPALRAAHEQALAGRYGAAALRELEDREIRDAIALQESVGLQAITDGELRRTSFHADFIEKLDGASSQGRLAVAGAPGGALEAAPAGGEQFAPRAFAVGGRLRHVRPIEVANFAFVRAHTRRTAKQTIPSPRAEAKGGNKS